MATVETGAVAVMAIKAGSLAAGIAYLTTDMELIMVIVVGLVGGMIFSFREIINLEVKTTKLKAIAELLFTIPVSISTAGIVYYLGVNVLNEYIPIGSIAWVFFALLASLHYKKVVPFFADTAKNIIKKWSEK